MKPLGLDKLQQFSGLLGMQHLDMPNLRGRGEARNEERNDDIRKAKMNDGFDFEPTLEVKMFEPDEEVEDGWTCKDRTDKWRLVKRWGSDHKGKPKPKPTEKGGGKTRKTKTQTWSDVVKGLKVEDELETANSDKSWNE